MRAVIMAGGKGTRLQSIVSATPKPMALIMNKPILEYQIESLEKCGISDITLIVGYLKNVIMDYFGDGQKWNLNINYIVEENPLGTAGALFYLKEIIKDDFVLIFGDLMLDVNWDSFMSFHKSKGGLITLYGHPNAHPFDSDIIVIDAEQCVTKIDAKNSARNYYYNNFVNAGLYCVSPKLLDCIRAPKKLDLEKEVILEQIPQGTIFAYRSTEYVKDIGTPDRYYSVIADVQNGIVSNRNLKNRQKCIFLDRDGTVNSLNGFVSSPAHFELITGITDAIKKINASKYLTIIVTNQPVIARGECTFDGLADIHKKMETQLGAVGAYIDDLLFCPHHPHKGYDGEVPELKIACNCRKPQTGMLDEAAEKYNIDLLNSWLIGDTSGDVQTGINAGMHTILLRTGEAGNDKKFQVQPEYTADSLLDAVDYILNQ